MARFAASLFAACLAVSILGARGDTAFTQTAPRPPLALTPYGKLAAKKEHRESAKRKREYRESAKKKRNIGRVLRKKGTSLQSREASVQFIARAQPKSQHIIARAI
jgi:hypothetical protein